jgi:hypothetical protein
METKKSNIEVIHLVIRTIGGLEDVIGPAYFNYEDADNKCKEFKDKSVKLGYTDFKFYVKTIDIQ